MNDTMNEQRYRRCLAAIFLGALVTGGVGIGWGLPNGNQTWAADALAPMTPLSVAYHVFVENGFNSGYFYFKYPVGHPLVMAILCSPVLAIAYLAGDLAALQADYPFGFNQPERYLTMLALIARATSAVLGAGLLLSIAGTARRLAGRRAGILAALAAAGSYPLVYYSHTSNVEIVALFWSFLALYATVRGVQSENPRWYWLLGTSAAMTISTKEQLAGFCVGLPAIIVLSQVRPAGGFRRYFPTGTAAGALLCVVVLLTVNAAFFNPSGFLNRVRFLTHTLPEDVRSKYAAYEFPIDYSTEWTLEDEFQHGAKAVRAVANSVGWHTAVMAAGGLCVLALRSPRGVLFLLPPLLGYYLFAIRLLKQVEIRYTLPLSTLLVIPAGVGLAWLAARGRLGRTATIGLLVIGLAYSGEVLLMLRGDARYRAETWLEPHLKGGKTVEVYQSWTYLPRWQHLDNVKQIPFADRTPAGLASRRPDFVVLSSKGKEGIMMRPNPDWRDGRGMMLEAKENRLLLDGLESESLGYQRVAAFERPRIFPREIITSLDPSVEVYARSDPDPK